MKCYKGFDKDLKCRGFQYEVGKEYEENAADICHNGFHACENPMDVLSYYNPAESRFCEVDLDANEQTENDSKRVGKRIKIKTEIGLSGLIQAGVKFILERVDFEEAKENNTGERSAATNTGNWSAATNTGDRSAATNTGYQSAATNTGNQSAATNTGERSAATVEGKESIAVVTGYASKAKGALGCWLVLTERDDSLHILGVQAVKVDGEAVKPGVFYAMIDGKVVEADD